VKPSTAKAKGRDTENKACAWLNTYGLLTERRRLNGNEDEGDIAGWPGVCVEVKSAAHIDIPRWLRELTVEMRHANAATGFVLARPKGQPHPENWWAILPTPVLMELMRAAGWLPTSKENAA